MHNFEYKNVSEKVPREQTKNDINHRIHTYRSFFYLCRISLFDTKIFRVLLFVYKQMSQSLKSKSTQPRVSVFCRLNFFIFLKILAQFLLILRKLIYSKIAKSVTFHFTFIFHSDFVLFGNKNRKVWASNSTQPRKFCFQFDWNSSKFSKNVLFYTRKSSESRNHGLISDEKCFVQCFVASVRIYLSIFLH